MANCFHSLQKIAILIIILTEIIVSVPVRHTVTVSETRECTFAFMFQRFGFAFPIIFSNPTKLLNIASFSHSLRNIQSLYPRGIMYIQSRRKLINALKLDITPSHTIRAKMRDESTCHWEPSFRGVERSRRIIYA